MLIHANNKELCCSCGAPLNDKGVHYFQGARVCKECKLELDEGYRCEQLGQLWADRQLRESRLGYALLTCFILWFAAVIGGCIWVALV